MSTIKLILCGLGTGAAMTIPGVSGGTAAILLGVYDKVIHAVSALLRDPKGSLPLLLKFGGGAAAGAVLLARLLGFLLTTPADIPLRFLFLGAVAGGVPLIMRRAELRRFTPFAALLILSGAAAVFAISALPRGAFSPENTGAAAYLLQFAGGLLLAAALVLPGISGSHLLYILGIYDDIMEKIGNADLLPLTPMVLGTAVGTFLSARILEGLLSRHKTGSYLVILGFILASLRELIPMNADGVQLSLGLICAAVGFYAVFCLQGSVSRSKTDGEGL